MSPKISVIVPVYNTGSKLLKCYKSILNQTFEDFECLLINDGSTDPKTLYLLKKISSIDSRFIVINKANEGIEKSRLVGVAKSKCDFLIFSDHDDYYEKNAFELLVNAQLEHDADIVSANCWHSYFSLLPFIKSKVVPNIGENVFMNHQEFINTYYQNFFGANSFPVSTWGKLYRKELFDEPLLTYNVNFIEDIVINSQLFERANTLFFINDYVYTHIYGGLSSTFDFTKGLMGYANIYEFRKELLNKYSLSHLPLLIEFKNVIEHYVNLLINYNYKLDEFIKLVSVIPETTCFKDICSQKISDSVILHLIEKREFVHLYQLVSKQQTYTSKLKYLVKRIMS